MSPLGDALTVHALGLGACTPPGTGAVALWQLLARGDDGFGPPPRVVVDALGPLTQVAFSHQRVRALCEQHSTADAALAFALEAAEQALAEATAEERAATGLVVATSAGAVDLHTLFDEAVDRDPTHARALLEQGSYGTMPAFLAERLGLGGPRLCVSTACASGGHALGLAAELLRDGGTPSVLVVGSDALHAALVTGFAAVGAMAPGPCAPFGGPTGMSLGEGAAAVWLSTRHAGSRGTLLGWGASTDGYHPTAPEPMGTGIARSLASALADANTDPQRVGVYSAHGTGTEANDSAEARAVSATIPHATVTAPKSQFGHTQGAAGVLEAVACWLGIEAQEVPPALRSSPPRRGAPTGLASATRAAPHAHDRALSHSSAFGGANVTLVLGPPDARSNAVPHRRVFASGTASLAGTGGRGADPLTTTLTQTLRALMADAGLSLRGCRGDPFGMVVGMADGPQHSAASYHQSIRARGPLGASAVAFSRIPMNAAAGAAVCRIPLRGPGITLWSGPGAGLQAVVMAAMMLAQRPDLEGMVAGGADEDGTLSRQRAALGQGVPVQPQSGLVLLSPHGGDVELTSWALAGANLVAAIERATGDTEPKLLIIDQAAPSELTAIARRWPHTELARAAKAGQYSPAADGAVGCGSAIRWVRQHQQRAVVASSHRTSGVVVTVWDPAVQEEATCQA